MIKKILSGILTFLIAMLAVSPVYATANGTQIVTVVIPSTCEIRIQIDGSGYILYEGDAYGNGNTIQVTERSDLALTIKADSQYDLKKVTYNNQDVTKQVRDGVLRIADVKQDGTVRVTFVRIEGSLPRTGDSRLLWAWAILAAGSFCLLVGPWMRRKKSKHI